MSKGREMFSGKFWFFLLLPAILFSCTAINSTDQTVLSGTAVSGGAGAGTIETQISCYGTPGIGMSRCFAGGQIVSAHLQMDASETGASCQSANSWGYRNNWIWVSGNCSGVFSVTISRQ